MFFLQEACKISQVLFMKRLLDSLLYQDINSVEYIYWASCLAGAQFLITSIGNHAYFYAEILGANCRSSCLSLVYQKVFRWKSYFIICPKLVSEVFSFGSPIASYELVFVNLSSLFSLKVDYLLFSLVNTTHIWLLLSW